MTTFNKQTLATFFQTGDVPQGSDYQNLIDSQVNIVETSAQVMGGPLVPTELITARVSAGNGFFTGTLSVMSDISAGQDLYVNRNLAVSGQITTASLFITNLTATSATVTNLNSTTVSANKVYSTQGIYQGVGVVSAAGTTQGTAAVLANIINRGKGIADGSTTGFTPLANNAGLVQYLFNEGASANLWPPTGGFINGLAINAAFPLVASAMVTIVHLTASAYGVK